MRLNYLSVWSNDEEEIIQIVYEDSDTGTVYLVRTVEAGGVSVITTEGEVSGMTKSEFEKLKAGEPID